MSNEIEKQRTDQTSSNNSSGAKEIDVRALLGEEREAVLVHAGERYRLRITASGKLILTK